MTNNTSLPCRDGFVALTTAKDEDFKTKQVDLSTSVVVLALSPVAVLANLLIWQQSGRRTPRVRHFVFCWVDWR